MDKQPVARMASFGPITNPAANRVCNLAGISAAKQQTLTFIRLKEGISLALRDLESQARRHEILANAGLVLKFTKATCDGFIGMAAEMTTFVPEALGGKVMQKQAKAIKAYYGMGSAAAEYGSTLVAGGNANGAKAMAAIARNAADLIKPDSLQMAGDSAKFLAKTTVIKTELIVGAMNGSGKGLRKSGAEYMAELTKFPLKALGSDRAAALVGIAKETFAYNDAINNAFDELLATRIENKERYLSAKRMLVRQAAQFQKKIDELDAFLRDCADEPVSETAPMSLP
jgi:hypothetical protein